MGPKKPCGCIRALMLLAVIGIFLPRWQQIWHMTGYQDYYTKAGVC